GILSAVWRNRWLDHLVRIMAITGISTPAFWLGLGVIVLFYGHLQILPGGGRLDDWLDPPTHVTGFYLLDALLEGNGEVFFNALQHLILPALTLAFVHLGIVARQIRSAMLEQLSEDYIRTARASGLSGWYIVLCYALPNALIPSITVLGLA
ncbi:ABC transporter permease, partial [Klebsiella pneumoniae]